MKKGKTKKMMDSNIKNKLSNILHFFLSSFTVMFTSVIVSVGAFIAIAVAGNLTSGDWTIGTSFYDWWASMTKSPIIDGKFSAVDFNTCWSCAFFSKLFDLMSIMGLRLYVYIADIAWTLITMGFAVWVVVYMYDNLILKQGSDVAGMLKDMAKKIIIISVIGAGLFYTTNSKSNEKYLGQMANTIFSNTAVPVLKMGIGLSSRVLQTDVCNKLYYPKESESDGIITNELKNDMLCLMNTVNTVYLSAMTAGSNMVSMSWKTFLKNPAQNAKYLPDIIAGMAIIAIFFLMYISIPFTLIDIVFTMGILIAFIPLMIGGYAYDYTKGFSKRAISSLWGMAFYIFMYSVFLGILYSSFVYIADMYYPGPLDNFTYLFPDFVYSSMVNSQTSNIELSSAFQSCYNSANGDIGKVQSCLLNIGIDLNMPSFDNPGGSFLPMFTFGLLSLMIMYGSINTYTKIIKGDMFEIGKYAKSLLSSSFSLIKSVSRSVAGYVGEKQVEKLSDAEFKKKEKELLDNAEKAEEANE